MQLITVFIVTLLVILDKVQCTEVPCPGVLPLNVLKHDFGGNKINVSCSYTFNVHSDHDGLILIGFRTVKLLPGDTFVIKSDGQNVFGPFTDSNYPTSAILPVNASVELRLNPHDTTHPRTVQGYFISKAPFVYRLNSAEEESNFRSPLYMLPANVKKVEVEYRINIKQKVSKTKNFTVWFEDVSPTFGSKQLQLKRQGFKDIKEVDPRQDYFVGNSFGVLFKHKSEFPDEKLTVKVRPIVGDCSHEYNYINSTQSFKPHERLRTGDTSNAHFECLLIVRSSYSPLRATIRNLDLGNRLNLTIKNGSSINSPPMRVEEKRSLKTVLSESGKLFFSLSGTRPIPRFEVALDCTSCNSKTTPSVSQQIRVADEPKKSSIPLIVCVTLGGSVVTAIAAVLVYKRYSKQSYRRPDDHIETEVEIFSRRR